MKILLVAMNSIHFTRWTEQLKESGHEVYWFNSHGTGYSNKIPWVEQVVDWKQKYPNLKGRHFIKSKFPFLYRWMQPIIENDTAKVFETALQQIKPDVVHSFVLYLSCAPILSVMEKYNNIPWIYSSWGSDLFYYKNKPKYLRDIKKVLPRIDYLMTDCQRDVGLAKTLGFKGRVLGVFPGGGGFDYAQSDAFIKPISDRNIILVKGYQGRSGRSINVLKALMMLESELTGFKIVVFGADNEVVDFTERHHLGDMFNFTLHKRSEFLPHLEVLQLMGQSLIYIGNSNSDGMPNTLLESIAMGAFPIQSNPGGATEEVIKNGVNGLLIQDCEAVGTIKSLIAEALNNNTMIATAFDINQKEVKPRFEREEVKNEVLAAYNTI